MSTKTALGTLQKFLYEVVQKFLQKGFQWFLQEKLSNGSYRKSSKYPFKNSGIQIFFSRIPPMILSDFVFEMIPSIIPTLITSGITVENFFINSSTRFTSTSFRHWPRVASQIPSRVPLKNPQ